MVMSVLSENLLKLKTGLTGILIAPVLITSPLTAQAENETLSSESIDAILAPVQQGARLHQPFLITGNQKGRLAIPSCRASEREQSMGREWARFINLYRQFRVTSVKNDMPEPLLFGNGNILFPGSFSRYLLASGEQGKERLLELTGSVPFDSFAVGSSELNIPWSELGEMSAKAVESGLPLQAANLSCHSRNRYPCNRPA